MQVNTGVSTSLHHLPQENTRRLPPASDTETRGGRHWSIAAKNA